MAAGVLLSTGVCGWRTEGDARAGGGRVPGGHPAGAERGRVWARPAGRGSRWCLPLLFPDHVSHSQSWGMKPLATLGCLPAWSASGNTLFGLQRVMLGTLMYCRFCNRYHTGVELMLLAPLWRCRQRAARVDVHGPAARCARRAGHPAHPLRHLAPPVSAFACWAPSSGAAPSHRASRTHG